MVATYRTPYPHPIIGGDVGLNQVIAGDCFTVLPLSAVFVGANAEEQRPTKKRALHYCPRQDTPSIAPVFSQENGAETAIAAAALGNRAYLSMARLFDGT